VIFAPIRFRGFWLSLKLMDLVLTVALFGTLQTVFALADLPRFRWVVLYCLILGVICVELRSWAEQVNFIHLNTLLKTDSAVFSIASVLFLEAVLKACLYVSDNGPPRKSGRHWILRMIRSGGIVGKRILQHTPTLVMVFSLYYVQAYVFHTSENISFEHLSLAIAVIWVVTLLLGVGILQRWVQQDSSEAMEYRLLFIQLITAITLPLFVGRSGATVPIFHGFSIYIQFAATAAITAFAALCGYLFYLFRNKRSSI
jgi:hypothetical protein